MTLSNSCQTASRRINIVSFMIVYAMCAFRERNVMIVWTVYCLCVYARLSTHTQRDSPVAAGETSVFCVVLHIYCSLPKLLSCNWRTPQPRYRYYSTTLLWKGGVRALCRSCDTNNNCVSLRVIYIMHYDTIWEVSYCMTS